MQIVLKPGAVLALILLLGGLAVFIVWHGNQADSDPIHQFFAHPSGTTTPQAPAAPSITTTNKMPFESETIGDTFKNPGFESDYTAVHPYDTQGKVTGQVAGHWYDDSSWAPNTVDYASDSINPHSGASSQRISVQASSEDKSVQFVQAVRLVPGKKYAGSLWLRADHSMTVHLLLRESDQGKAVYGQAEAKIGTEWQRVTAIGTIGVDPVTYLMLRIPESGNVWADDASIAPEN